MINSESLSIIGSNEVHYGMKPATGKLNAFRKCSVSYIDIVAKAIEKNICTRKSSCVNARGIPTAAYHTPSVVLPGGAPLLGGTPLPGGTPPWVPPLPLDLARGPPVDRQTDGQTRVKT